MATLTPFPLLTALFYYNLKARFCPIEPKEKEMQDLSKEKAKEVEASISLVNGKEDSNQNMADSLNQDMLNLIKA